MSSYKMENITIGQCYWSPVLFAVIFYARILIWWERNSVNIPTITLLHVRSKIQVITFDERGVSDHPNHIATYRGVQQFFRDLRETDQKVVGLKLLSTNVMRKFLGFFDIIFSIFTSDHILLNYNLFQVFRGMAAHRSQNVWYRILFVLFSRYTYMNTFSSISWAYYSSAFYLILGNWKGISLGHVFTHIQFVPLLMISIAQSAYSNTESACLCVGMSTCMIPELLDCSCALFTSLWQSQWKDDLLLLCCYTWCYR